MPEATLELLSNAGLVSLCLVVFMLAKSGEQRIGRRGVEIATGLSFGAIAGAMMLAPITLGDAVQVDLRASMLFLSAFAAGPLAGLLTMLVADAVRLAIGTSDPGAVLLAALAYTGIGLVMRYAWMRLGRRHLAVILLAATILLCMVSTVAIVAADRAAGLTFVRTVLPSYAAVMGLSVISFGILLQQEAEHFASMAMMREAHQRALEADRAKSDFLARMTHELRTPLNAILGFSEMIKLGIGGNDVWKYVEYGEDIHRSGLHLLSLVNDVLDASRLQNGPVELREAPLSLVKVTHEVARGLRSLTEKKTLTIEVALDGIDDIVGDERAIRQIVLNLMGNAIRHAPERSAVTVMAWCEDSELRLGVRDRGPGIPAAKRARLTEPFGAIDGSWVGTAGQSGLGLSIAHSLAVAHGGRLFVTDPPGGVGIIVGVALPASRIVPMLPALAA